MTDSSNPWDVYQSQLHGLKRYEEQRHFWQMVMSSEVGRREVWGLLDLTHAFQVQFAHSPTGTPDPLASWFQAGQHSIGQTLYLMLLKFARAETMLMHDECDARMAKPSMPQEPQVPRDDLTY